MGLGVRKCGLALYQCKWVVFLGVMHSKFCEKIHVVTHNIMRFDCDAIRCNDICLTYSSTHACQDSPSSPPVEVKSRGDFCLQFRVLTRGKGPFVMKVPRSPAIAIYSSPSYLYMLAHVRES